MSAQNARNEQGVRPLRRTLLRWLLVLLFLPYGLVLVYSVVPPISTVMLGSLLTGQGMQRDWVPLEQISPHLVRAVLIAEDARFCEHLGIDFTAIQKSLKKSEKTGKAPKGASTITAQTVKNLFFWNGRSWLRKVFEAPLTLWLDLILTKRRVMEIYLNSAEWGEGVFGAEMAAQKAFGKPALRLSPQEAALLAAALPAPLRRNAAAARPYHRRYAAVIAGRAARNAEVSACVLRPRG